MEQEGNAGTEIGPTLRQGWPLIAGSFFSIFTAYSNAFLLGPMLDVMGRDLHQPVSVLGQLAAISFIPWGFGAPFVGILSDHYGRKPVLLAGLLGMTLANLAASVAPDFWTLALCRFLTGLCGSCVPPSCVAALGDAFTGRTRGNAMAIASTGISISLIAGLPGIAFLTGVVGWRGGFVAAALVGVGAALSALWAFPWGRHKTATPPATLLGGFAWMRGSSPWYVISGNFCERIILGAFLTYVSVLLIRQYGIDQTSLAGMLTAMSIGTLIGSLAGGPLSGLRRRYLWIAVLILLQATFVVLMFSGATPLGFSVAAGFLYSMISQMSRPVVMDTLVTLAPRSRGVIIGFFATSNQIGQMVGASVGGLAIAWGGFPAIGAMSVLAAAGGVTAYVRLTRRLDAAA